VIAKPSQLRLGPAEESEAVREMPAGETFRMLDDTLGWAWGYAGQDQRVGYIPSDAVSPKPS
jgi:hypothetical protein